MNLDTSYWNNKIAAFLHDPFDKALKIPGHEGRAVEYLKALGVESCQEKFWKTADVLAAGFERAVLPGYQADEKTSGAVNFLQNPVTTHPVSSNSRIGIDVDVKDINYEEIKGLIENDITIIDGGNEIERVRNRFYYLYFLLRYRLASKNISGLGGLWHRLPADTRMPDHSIWHHNALVSALYSSMELAKAQEGVALAVFSITPVQGFIAKARKLRDYWTSSILLSWLAFEGIRYVTENLGPDHVLYPSLLDQPLVEMYLKRIAGFDALIQESCLPKPSEIATFPNKFLFLLPYSEAKDFCEKIKETILSKWNELSLQICSSIVKKCSINDKEKNAIEKMFKRQTGFFWDINYACAGMIGERDIDSLKNYFEEEVYKASWELAQKFAKLSSSSFQGCFYNVTHRLVQSALASAKSRRTIHRLPENGEKCHLCGEFEVLHTVEYPEDVKASTYTKHIQAFWEKVKQGYGKFDFTEGEKLCAVCVVKRLAAIVLKGNSHILSHIFANADAFPSTTEIALDNFFKRYNIENKNDKWEIAQNLHENDEFEKQIAKVVHTKIKMYEEDKYYAILLMDGDNMGSLINGESVASTWETVIHPEIVHKLKNKTLADVYTKEWEDIFKSQSLKKRMLSPAVHAAISEALGDFSLFSVKEIIERYRGRLIYAGGDDICAILPAFNALNSAREIQNVYCQPFVFVDGSGKVFPLSEKFTPQVGKMAIQLGKGEKISISAAILICHHKESLSEMIARAHGLLDNEAKASCNRNACAIELKKRSGGSRYFAARWDDPVWDNFNNIFSLFKDKSIKERLSNSLVYRLEEMRDGIIPIIEKDNTLGLYQKFVKKLLTKSLFSEKNPDLEKIAWDVVKITCRNNSFTNEGLIIASFLVGGGR